MESHEVMKAMVERARELGWEAETDWKDCDEDGGAQYELWLWPAEDTAPASGEAR